MKVFVVDPWHFTPPYDRELCGGLVKAGHQVVFVRDADATPPPAEVGKEGHGVRTLGLFPKPARWLPRFFLLIVKGLLHIWGMLKLYIEVRKQQPDVIHFQWLSLPVVDAAFLPLLRRIAPVILTVHDSNPYNGSGPWLLRAGSNIAMRRCNQFIVHNEVSEKSLIEHGLASDRIHRIAHGLLEQVALDHEQTSSRTDRRLHLLQFGKLKAYKGADVLLSALAILRPEIKNKCRVSIVGRPYIDVEPLLEIVAKQNLRKIVDLRFDFVSDEEMVALFDETDYLVFPYREIDTSGVLMVAAARGIPVIASDIGCFAEMLTDGKEAILVPPCDIQALADAITMLVTQPERQTELATGMRALRDRIPSWQAIADVTTDVYRRAQIENASHPLGAQV